MDEVQNVKNPRTKQSQVVRALESSVRWGLSGTPLENSIEELAAIIETLDPDAAFSWSPAVGTVKSAARQMMIRRRKEDVLKDLPPINAPSSTLTPRPSSGVPTIGRSKKALRSSAAASV